MAPNCSKLVLTVRRQEAQLVIPAKPTPREVKYLSDIDDQEGLRIQMPFTFFLSNNNNCIKNDAVGVIRDALARALVYYYPMAGRLKEGPNRQLTVDCTGELGVLFIEADADVSLQQLEAMDAIKPPCPYLQDLLYDPPSSSGIIGCPLLLIQVTRLSCGGLVVATRVNHTITDALGIYHFFNTIGELARGYPAPSLPPIWHRHVLNARDPPNVTGMHHEYDDIVLNTTLKPNTKPAHKSFFFGAEEITAIRRHLPPHLRQTTSTFDLLAACLWRCRTIAMEEEQDPNQTVRIAYMVSALGLKLLPRGYYGNGFAILMAVTTAELLCKNPLEYAVDVVRGIKSRMSVEYMRSVADLMVVKGRPLFNTTSGTFIIADSSRVPFGNVDFGWGKPVYGGVARAAPGTSFFVRFKDGVLVHVSLEPHLLDRFEKELAKMTGQRKPTPKPIKSKL